MQYKQSVQYSGRSKIAYRQSLLSDLLTYELMMFSIAESPRLARNTPMPMIAGRFASGIHASTANAHTDSAPVVIALPIAKRHVICTLDSYCQCMDAVSGGYEIQSGYGTQ